MCHKSHFAGNLSDQFASFVPTKGHNETEVCPLKWEGFPQQHLQQQVLSEDGDKRQHDAGLRPGERADDVNG